MLFCLLPAVLPVPTLVLQQQTDVWCLLCTGSPAYPGAVFYLYLADGELPVATRHASVLSHQATFPVPVQDTLLALYQCQFSIVLGRKWSNSERSLPLTVTRGADLNFNCVSVDYYRFNRKSDIFFSFSPLSGPHPPSTQGISTIASQFFP